MKKIDSSLLQTLGLTASQAKVYMAALELGEASMQDLARKSEVKRSTIYHFIDFLKEKRLIIEITKGKRVKYCPVEPERLLEMERARFKELQNIIPDLQSIHDAARNKSRVTFHEGVGGIKEIYAEILKEKKPLVAWGGNLPEIWPVLGDFFAEFGPERARRNITFRWIMPDTQAARDFSRRNYGLIRETKFVSKDIRTEINVFGNKVGMVSFRNTPFGVLIEDEDIATTLREAWEAAWELLPY